VEVGHTCDGVPSTCGMFAAGDLCENEPLADGSYSLSGYAREAGCESQCGRADRWFSVSDDANIVAGDGCSPTCAIEAGHGCDGVPSACLVRAAGDLCETAERLVDGS
jgi:large repetitive protein